MDQACARAARPAGAQACHAARTLLRLWVRAMSSLGSFAKGLALFVGKQPEDEHRGRGFLGLEWVERAEAGHTLRRGQPRALGLASGRRGAFEPGDRILKIKGNPVDGIKGARDRAFGNSARRQCFHFWSGVIRARAVKSWRSP